ncbi:hypothetical protein ATK30_5226 [Amycolatopsis echigonensis]|uniref:Uncharacterized protein n=1 Tax=Amycolatopsis echigonensis TaxID=2576905 RepID=A0A2N3WKE3_9PSEU|nr:hypothetical protein ATK30_5226 [Amycolatopsis niigatensis]
MNSTSAQLTAAQRTWVAVFAPTVVLLSMVVLGLLG